MASFNYYNSLNRKAIKAQKSFFGPGFIFLTSINTFIFLFGFYLLFSPVTNSGVGKIVIGLVLLFQSWLLAKKNIVFSVKKSGNVVDKFTPDLVELIDVTLTEARKENKKEISAEEIFENLSLTVPGKLFCIRIGMPLIDPINAIPRSYKVNFSSQLTKLFSEVNSETIDVEDFILASYRNYPRIKEYIDTLQVKESDLVKLAHWLKDIKDRSKKKKFWEDTTSGAGIGQDWSSGYTPVLSLYSFDLSGYFKDPNLRINIFGHQNQIKEVETILAKTGKNNCILVGEPGVGKKTIVNALAMKIARGQSLSPLKYKKIRQLDVGRLLSGAEQGELEARVEGILSDAASAGNIILFIDNFQSLLGGPEEEILVPYLQSSNLQIIAAVSPSDYFEKVRSNSAVSGAFEKVEVNPANADETLGICLESLVYLESNHNVLFLLQTLRKIIDLSDRYLHEVPFPEKALRLMEEASVNFSQDEIKLILPKDIEDLVSKKANVPVGQVKEEEKEKLLNLEEVLHKRVIGQNEALKAISDALRRARAGITTGKRPIGVFLFLGPTGVGKTETAKALSESYFGSEKDMIRLDMSEYQEINSINRLMGTVESPNGVLTEAVLAKPFSLILLDEIEKADRNVLNLFLQVFEDGRLTDPRGRVIDFTNTIIIATSNAGSEEIRQAVLKNNLENIKTELLNLLQEQGKFTPEFLNRFDDVIIFKPLTAEEIKQVAQLMIQQINKNLEAKQIQIQIQPDALDALVKMGYDPQFGARPMRRVIQEKVENLLAKKLISGELPEGSALSVALEDIK